ncbi:9247_t:CDS:2, partial [Cetraspora pellucida]
YVYNGYILSCQYVGRLSSVYWLLPSHSVSVRCRYIVSRGDTFLSIHWLSFTRYVGGQTISQSPPN